MKGAVFMLAALAATHASAADTPACKMQMIASLPLLDDKLGMPMVSATLGDKQVPMLVDTGGTFSMIGKHIADETHAYTSRIAGGKFSLVDNKDLKEIAQVRPFALGEMRTEKFDFLVLPDGEVGPRDLAGTIAPDILANFDVEFDFAHHEMNLFSQDRCPGKVVYWAKDWAEVPFSSPDNLHIVVDMTLDGKPMKAQLDTGSSSSFLSESVAKEMFGVVPTTAPATNETDPAEPHAFSHAFKSLSMNGVTMNAPEFVILPDKKSSLIGHYGKMLLGMNELKRFHLFIAYKEEVLYITAADAH